MGVTNNNLITAPVSISDVKSVLGATSNDLGTLCKRSNINVWAKYRPFMANNANGYIGLRNAGTTSSPNWVVDTSVNWDTSDGYNVISLNFYRNSGSPSNNAFGRYNMYNALGIDTSRVIQATHIYYNNGIANIEWPINTNEVDPKYYRLLDFNGYYHKAKPREVFYCSNQITQEYFGIIIDSLATTNDYKKYCLSSTWLFDTNSSNITYKRYFLGVMFTKNDNTCNSLLINTGIQLGKYSPGPSTTWQGFFTNDSGFHITDSVLSVERDAGTFIIRDNSGYVTSSTQPQWAAVKSEENRQIQIFPKYFPDIYKRWFTSQYTYTVQLVAVETTSGTWNNMSILNLNAGDNHDSNGYYYSNLYSLNIKNGCFLRSGITYTSESYISKNHYDADGNVYERNGSSDDPVRYPTFNITNLRVSSVTNRYNNNMATASNAKGICLVPTPTGNTQTGYWYWRVQNLMNATSGETDGYILFTIEFTVTNYNANGSTGSYYNVEPTIVKNIPTFFTTNGGSEPFVNNVDSLLQSLIYTPNSSGPPLINANGNYTLYYQIKFNNPNDKRISMIRQNNYTSDSFYGIEIYFDFAPTQKATLNIPHTLYK